MDAPVSLLRSGSLIGASNPVPAQPEPEEKQHQLPPVENVSEDQRTSQARLRCSHHRSSIERYNQCNIAECTLHNFARMGGVYVVSITSDGRLYLGGCKYIRIGTVWEHPGPHRPKSRVIATNWYYVCLDLLVGLGLGERVRELCSQLYNVV